MMQTEAFEVEAEVGEDVEEEGEGAEVEDQRVERFRSPRLCPNY